MGDRWQREELCQELETFASEIDDGLLSFASAEAKHEWMSFVSRWRPASSVATMDDDDLVVVVQKAQRFKGILRTMKAKGVPGNALRLRRAHA